MRHRFLAATLVAAVAAATLRSSAQEMPDFAGATGWINSPPIAAGSLRGKVVLVDFWEYTCINCLRTLPYLREWYKRYKDLGFTIVGVHTPEFKFSGEEANVAAAVKHLDVTWPVALDDDMTIWKRYGVNEWPTELLFDQNGKLVDRTQGEGLYQQTEMKIQGLLKAQNPSLHLPPPMALLPRDSYLKPGAVCYLQTPETYVGFQHGNHIGDRPSMLDPTDFVDRDSDHQDGTVYLQGYWKPTASGDAMVSDGGNGYLALKYHAIQVVTVMRPDEGSPIRVNVTEDGKPIPKVDAGKDIKYDASGTSYVEVDAGRAYDILMNAHFGTYDLRLMPQSRGLAVYSFAFESCEKSPEKDPTQR
ncbi:MAG TPA: redoxin domain-containing protein [Candidatus Acidoferrales bacterium]|nr:redoxin domain-containing protein [Candidatus Acidoferrales bacterium]